MSLRSVCTIYKFLWLPLPLPPIDVILGKLSIRGNVLLCPLYPLKSEFSPPSLPHRIRNLEKFRWFFQDTTFMRKYGNGKKIWKNVKESVGIIMWKNEEICGSRTYKSEARCESSYIPFSLSKGPGTWKNSMPFPHVGSGLLHSLWNLEK